MWTHSFTKSHSSSAADVLVIGLWETFVTETESSLFDKMSPTPFLKVYDGGETHANSSFERHTVKGRRRRRRFARPTDIVVEEFKVFDGQ